MSEIETAVLYLEKQRFYFSDGSKIGKFDFPQDIIKDFEIVNIELFTKMVSEFIDNSKFNAGKFLFVLSESSIFQVGSDEKNIAYMPFNNVLSKEYKLKEGSLIIATNKDMIDLLSDIFIQKGFGRDEIVPASVFGQFSTFREFNLEVANILIKNQEMATGRSMLDPIPVLQQPVSEVFKVTKGKSTMLPMLLGIMGVMVLILILLLVFRK